LSPDTRMDDFSSILIPPAIFIYEQPQVWRDVKGGGIVLIQ